MPRGRIAKSKSTILKTCENPNCKKGINKNPKKFWGFMNDKYCCPSCLKEAWRIKKTK